ncbi:hypothetical protein [uncultured Gammaproteobacteria bacterium]|uniref:hypothetical protein n=1 Tax=Bathymodiolus heckerae thiotrophic gill symbiont TaxID=1052212 RepID=UPI0010BC7422|nr:hypothetical protein [Bathymodiolus heckerae thiotrophic gill symbiont]CAC9527557.1 hypothetical protein [uncultured Gammaproteobacteria bacterium]CAC9584067.1 hypothetical protein [uncultured Gammaproteobacteria bacterium]CAC9595311.1 hypothetical protein [uncultured Gammaproteobacteria bacterium]CAC9959046.1 hypothetical protein [uncultured Gammaproteobacteria bacterium]SHN92504.1 hypothetical protein BHECKSOX_920 [Bathymodiolus heckerae thiotrophic gill symbiont]
MNSKTWINLYFIALVAIFSLSSVLFYIVNPSHYFESESNISSHNTVLSKYNIVSRIKPSSIILGSSRAERGYNPTHKYFLKPSFNFGMGGPSIFDIKNNFKHTLKQGNLKQVLLVIDYLSFNANIMDKTSKNNKSLYQQILNTPLDLYHTKKSHYNNGMRINENKIKSIKKQGGHLKAMAHNDLKFYKNYPKINYTYLDTGSSSFFDFEEIVRLSYENNIQLDIVFGPSHIRQWEALDYYRDYNLWLKWKSDVVTSVHKIAHIYNKPNYKVFDFSVYHPLTAEDVPHNKEVDMQYHWESSHYKNTLGAIVLDRLTGESEYSDFGVEIDTNNIKKHIKNQIINRRLYIDTRKYREEIWGKN